MSYRVRGLGLTQAQALQCAGSFWSYATTPECWKYTGSELESTLTPPTGAVTSSGPPAPAAAYTDTTGTPYMELYASAQQGNDANLAAIQAANLAQAQAAYNAPAVFGSSDVSTSLSFWQTIPWWAWLGIGVGGVVLLRKVTN